jgi:hypothetical protein
VSLPGLAILYGGLAWVIYGYTLAFGTDIGRVIGSPAKPLRLKLEPIGTINVSGALSVYTIHSNNKTDEKKIRYDVGSAIISLSKPAEPFGFTLIGGAYAFPVVGLTLSKTSESTDLFSPIPVAYSEHSPIKGCLFKQENFPT